jgi:hypothetical protein
MNGPCRCVPVVALARKSLKTLRRGGWRAGACRYAWAACNPLKTLSVAVRAGARVKNPHTPYSPKGSARALPTGLRRVRIVASSATSAAFRLTSPYKLAAWLNRGGNTRRFRPSRLCCDGSGERRLRSNLTWLPS